MKKTFICLGLSGVLLLYSALSRYTFHKVPEPVVTELEKIAGEYRGYELLDSEYQYTLRYCDPGINSKAWKNAFQVSRFHDMDGRGNKLYRLWVKDLAAYPDYNKMISKQQEHNVTQPFGQALVKESWTWDTVDVEGDQPPEGMPLYNGQYLVPRERKLLFIMYKTDTREYKTADGWVYGIYDVPDKKVLEGGTIKSCNGCHKPQQDYMFGINF